MDVGMSIAGRFVRGDRRAVENPATATVFAHAPEATDSDVDLAVRAAGEAFPGWAAEPFETRAKALLDCGAAVEAHLDELTELLTLEQGKTLRDARAEVRLAADWFRHTSELVLRPETLLDEQSSRIVMDRVPYGPVAAIAPYNFPIILAITKVAPALLAGNTVVLKPSEVTPLATLRIGQILQPLLPPGVFNVISGDGGVGARLTRHPGIRLVSFTGSVPTGRLIAGDAAATFTHTVLELGGNDACVVLPDADVAAVSGEIFARAMVNSGQFCAAIKRVYVSEDQRDELVDALVEHARAARFGPGTDETTQYGPLATRAQLERVTDLVASAERRGGRVLAGGRPTDLAGHFHAPTVVTDLPPDTPLEMEEQFGPVIPVMSYRTVEDAVARANATEFGLGGSVWGRPQEALAVAARLECGTAWVNTHGDLHPVAPFGGFRSSGVGVEYGYWGLLEYTRIKVLNIARR